MVNELYKHRITLINPHRRYAKLEFILVRGANKLYYSELYGDELSYWARRMVDTVTVEVAYYRLDTETKRRT